MYSKTHWRDRVVDSETGEVIQEGTFMSAEHFNNIENGIAANDAAISGINNNIDIIETTLETEVGTTINLTINQSTFVMKFALKNSEGTVLSEEEVDLPIESMIINAEYVADSKSLILTLQSGSTVTVPLSALINGLVNESRKVAGIDLKDDITVPELESALEVDKLKTNVDKIANQINGNLTDSDFFEDSTVSMTKTVPTGMSNYAAVKSIGGRTVKTKNLLNYSLKSGSMNGLTYTVNSDKSITFNGTTTAKTDIHVWGVWHTSAPTLLPENTYIINLGISTGSFNGLNFCAVNNTNIVGFTSKVNPKKTFTSRVSDVYFSIDSGSIFNNFTVYPMITLSTETDQTYEPYFEGLHNAPVESVVSTSADGTNKTTLLIPDSIKSLPDYGVRNNYVDFENMKYHHIDSKRAYEDGDVDSDTVITDGVNETVYQLATEEVIDISDMLMPIRCESGGTITFQNEHNLDMPNTVVYKKEVSLI